MRYLLRYCRTRASERCFIDMENNAIEKTNKYLAGTYARQNVAFVSGHGSYLVDDTGREYIDFGSGIAVNGLGLQNSEVNSAVCAQLNKISHTSNLYYNEPQGELGKLLCTKTGMSKVFLSNSGAEANECAIKAARKYSFDKYGEGRSEIIALKNSFHGRTVTTLSATGQESFHTYFMPFTEGFTFVEAGNFDALNEAASDKTCAVMLELVQGEGGVIALDGDYVNKVCKLCADKDILVVIDEVQTGNGRSGSLYAYMEYGISPDIVTTAKGLANGLPIGATLFNAKTSGVLTAGTHGSTFGGNLLSCAAAVATLKQIDQKLLDGVKAKHKLIVNTLSALPKVKSVTGMGLMLGIECDNNKEIVSKCLEKGLVVLTAKSKIRLLPALNIDDKTLQDGLNILKEVLQ